MEAERVVRAAAAVSVYSRGVEDALDCGYDHFCKVGLQGLPSRAVWYKRLGLKVEDVVVNDRVIGVGHWVSGHGDSTRGRPM